MMKTERVKIMTVICEMFMSYKVYEYKASCKKKKVLSHN